MLAFACYHHYIRVSPTPRYYIQGSVILVAASTRVVVHVHPFCFLSCYVHVCVRRLQPSQSKARHVADPRCSFGPQRPNPAQGERRARRRCDGDRADRTAGVHRCSSVAPYWHSHSFCAAATQLLAAYAVSRGLRSQLCRRHCGGCHTVGRDGESAGCPQLHRPRLRVCATNRRWPAHRDERSRGERRHGR